MNHTVERHGRASVEGRGGLHRHDTAHPCRGRGRTDRTTRGDDIAREAVAARCIQDERTTGVHRDGRRALVRRRGRGQETRIGTTDF